MTVFTDLLADVYTITNRPDLVNATKLAIRSATLKAHQIDFFYKDLFETGITFLTAEYQQVLAYKELVPRWRAFKYLRISDINGTDTDKFLTLITPDSVLDDYAVNRENVVYFTGLEFKTRTLAKSQYFLLGCYLNPITAETGYSSWIAEEYPFAIIFEAAAQVFKGIGFDEQVAVYRNMCAEQYASLKAGNIVALGS